MSPQTRSPKVHLALIVLWYVAWIVAGTLLIRSATPRGTGIRHDSLSYLTAALSLSSGDCLCRIGSGLERKPLVHFGPAYPVLLSAVTLLTRDLLVSARWIVAVLYGVNLAMWGGLVHLYSRRLWAGAFVTGLLATSIVLLQVHDAAMSEPLFLAILAGALMVLVAYLIDGKRRYLWLAAGAVAAATLTRYAAGFLLGGGIAAILLLRRAPWRIRFGDAARFTIGAVVPVAVWLGRNLVVAGSATNRTLRWHPITVDDLRSFLRVVTAWFTSSQYSHWIEGAILLAALLAIGALLFGRRRLESGQANPSALLGLLLVGLAALYPASIAVSKSLFDQSIPIDDRMLSPMYVSLVALFGVLAAMAWKRRGVRWIILALAGVFVIGVSPYMSGRYQRKLEEMRSHGVLFASRVWQESESIAWARSLPEEALLYSNQALILQFLSGRPVYQIPEGFDTVKGEIRTDYEVQVAQMRDDLLRSGSFLLVFDPTNPVALDDVEDEWRQGLDLYRVLADGVVMAGGDGGDAR